MVLFARQSGSNCPNGQILSDNWNHLVGELEPPCRRIGTTLFRNLSGWPRQRWLESGVRGSNQSCWWPIVLVTYCVGELFCLWTILLVCYPDGELSCWWAILFVNYPTGELSGCWVILLLNYYVGGLSWWCAIILWNYLVGELSFWWNILLLVKHVGEHNCFNPLQLPSHCSPDLYNGIWLLTTQK